MTIFITAKIEALMPKLVTRRDIIRNVPDAWRSSYNDDTRVLAGKQTAGSIRMGLEALDIETATPDDIKQIIGNDSWTRLECRVCEMDREAVVKVPKEYGDPTLICRQCAEGVAAVFADAEQS